MLWDHLGGGARPILKVEFWNRHYKRIKYGCELLDIKIPKISQIVKQRETILKSLLIILCMGVF